MPAHPTASSVSRRENGLHIGALLGVWVLAAAIVDCSGELPLNDDWAYAHVVRGWFETGRIQFTDLQSMPLLTNVLWGALFCLPLGFSVVALRVSSLAAGFLGGVGVYLLLRELRVRPRAALFGALLFSFNPIYFLLSFTFMTDVVFTALTVWSLYFWIRGGLRGEAYASGTAVVLAVLATLSRQLGLALPIAFFLGTVLHRRNERWWLLRALLPFAAVLGALELYTGVVAATIGLPALYHLKEAGLRAALIDLLHLHGVRVLLEHTGIALCYVGLFCLPFCLVFGYPKFTFKRVGATLGGIAVLAALVIASGRRMPLTSNVLLDFGLGPRTVPGEVSHAPASVALILTVLAVAGAVPMLAALGVGGLQALRGVSSWLDGSRLGQWLKRLPQSRLSAWELSVLLSVAVMLFLPTGVAYQAYFDRYVLGLLPPALALSWAYAGGQLSTREMRLRSWAALILVGVIGVFAVGATHDYLAWQRTRWGAVQKLRAQSVAPEQLAGGYEVDNYGPQRLPRIELGPPAGARFMIASSRVEGHEVVSVLPIATWMPWALDQLFVLERK